MENKEVNLVGYIVPNGKYSVSKQSKSKKKENLDDFFNIENNSGKHNILEEIQKDKKEFLEDIIKEINDLIETRENMSKNIFNKIDRELCKCNNKLCELTNWYPFNNKDVEKTKIEFEALKANLKKEKSRLKLLRM